MMQRKAGRVPDTERVERWRSGLIADMGHELRQVVELLHRADPESLVTVLRALRRCSVPELLQQGVSLYWRELTHRKRTGAPLPKGGV